METKFGKLLWLLVRTALELPGKMLGQSPASTASTWYSTTLYITLADGLLTSKMRQHINLVVPAIYYTAAAVIVGVTYIACLTALQNIMDIQHWLGTYLISGFAIWGLTTVARQAQETVCAVKASPYMNAYRMVMREYRG